MSTTPPPGCPAYGHRTGLLPLSYSTGAQDAREVFRALREQWGTVAQVELEPGVTAWLVMGYRELLMVARQEQLFSRDSNNWRDLIEGVVPADSGLLPMMASRATVVGADGPEHRRLRQPIEDSLAGIDQRRARRLVERRCTELIARFSGRGRADLVTEYAALVSMVTMGSLFGLDSGVGGGLVKAIGSLMDGTADSHDGDRLIERIAVQTMLKRQREPADDLTTAFIRHPNFGTDEERIQAIMLMLFAANESITAWVSHALRLMLTDPRFASRLRGGRLGVDDALDEALWREPPMNNMPARYALRDTELGGRFIRRGDCLVLGIAAANDDPEIRAEEGEEEWGNRAHLAFSAGPHVCPAQVPARLITRTAVSTAMHLLPDMRLSIPADEVAWRPSPWYRVPLSLPAQFSVLPAAVVATGPTASGLGRIGRQGGARVMPR